MSIRNSLSKLVMVLLAGGFAAACADVTTSSAVPASIEFNNLAAPALVVGDTLRDITGKAAPVIAIVRNQQGEVLPDAVVRYTYADAARDSALLIDSLAGFVFATKALKGSGTTARIAARVGNNLQVIRTVLVTIRPDSVDQKEASPVGIVQVSTPDTARGNTSDALLVTVRHFEGTTETRVPNWLVKYEVVQPANPTNDSTKSAFLVNGDHRLSNIDTTDATGSASRFVRVRAAQFPVGLAPDTVVVRATVTYRGQHVKGSPVAIKVPVIKKP